MKLKERVRDFQVRELLDEGFLAERGEHRIYRVTKRKLTTDEAIRVLAQEAGVEPADVSVAGLKDRQGVTIQHMSVPRGREVRIRSTELRIETAGFAREPLRSEFSRGNAFEINVRALDRREVLRLRAALPYLREHGVVNYFDDQRFGNLEHGQGWIARNLMRGKHEKALLELLTARSQRDDPRRRAFKDGLRQHWGDWRACRNVAGKFGAHHSIFEHLSKAPDDFAGAFTFVSSRIRLIHLYAYQSHLWNRAVADLVRDDVPLDARVVMDGIEGPLVSWKSEAPEALRRKATFRLPGDGLEDVSDRRELEHLVEVLARERMVPDDFRIEGVSGFRLKGEDRPLVVVPRHLRVRPAEDDPENRGQAMVRVRFELPRGSYATLVIRRLLAAGATEEARRPARRPHGTDVPSHHGRPDAGRRGGGYGRDRRGRGEERDEHRRGDREAGRGRAGGGAAARYGAGRRSEGDGGRAAGGGRERAYGRGQDDGGRRGGRGPWAGGERRGGTDARHEGHRGERRGGTDARHEGHRGERRPQGGWDDRRGQRRPGGGGQGGGGQGRPGGGRWPGGGRGADGGDRRADGGDRRGGERSGGFVRSGRDHDRGAARGGWKQGGGGQGPRRNERSGGQHYGSRPVRGDRPPFGLDEGRPDRRRGQGGSGAGGSSHGRGGGGGRGSRYGDRQGSDQRRDPRDGGGTSAGRSHGRAGERRERDGGSSRRGSSELAGGGPRRSNDRRGKGRRETR